MKEAAPTWGRRLAAILLAVYGSLLAGLILAIAWFGRSFYLLPLDQRADHPLHPLLASGEGVGLGAGVLGTTLMVAMLSYTLRKQFPNAKFLGPLPLWLRFHILCGVAGPLLIVLHAGVFIAPTGLIAVGFWCMVLVALSGVFGRYVYQFLPRMTSGKALAWDEAMTTLADLRADLVAATAHLGGHAVGDAVGLARDFEMQASTVPDLFRLDREVRQRKRQIHLLLRDSGLPDDVWRQAETEVAGQLQLKSSLEASRVAYRLFRYWHLFHRPLASAMYVIVTLHVLSAILLGGSLTRLIAFFGG